MTDFYVTKYMQVIDPNDAFYGSQGKITKIGKKDGIVGVKFENGCNHSFSKEQLAELTPIVKKVICDEIKVNDKVKVIYGAKDKIRVCTMEGGFYNCNGEIIKYYNNENGEFYSVKLHDCIPVKEYTFYPYQIVLTEKYVPSSPSNEKKEFELNDEVPDINEQRRKRFG